MSIADKLTLLADTKEALRVKLDLGVDVPFSEYVDYIKQQDAITKLFLNGERGVWYDPSDKSTLFQDVAGTVPVTKDGDPVGLMKDKSGSNNHMVQPTASKRPVYRRQLQSAWLQFDGVDDYMKSVSSFNPRSIVIAMNNKKTHSSAGFSLWSYWQLLSRHNGIYYSGDSGVEGGYGRFVSTLANLGATYVASLVIDSQDSRLSFKGVSATHTGGISGTPSIATKLYLGARVIDNEVIVSAWHGQIDIFKMIVTESVLSVNDEALAADYVASNMGITL